MPRRTNAFQELVGVIHANLGPGWKVTESCFLPDGVTQEMREVDVVAQATVGGYGIIISIECRDQTRPCDVSWVEGMAMKHQHLATSKLVLWSRSGFTKQALTKAAAMHIETVSQASAREAEWAKLARELVGARVRLVTPRFSPFVDARRSDGSGFRIEEVGTSNIYDSQGALVHSIPSILATMANSAELGSTLLDHAPDGAGDFYGELKPPVPWFIDSPAEGRVEVQRVGISVSTHVEELKLDAASAVVKGSVATLAAANTTGGRFQCYVEERPDGLKTEVKAFIRKPQT